MGEADQDIEGIKRTNVALAVLLAYENGWRDVRPDRVCSFLGMDAARVDEVMRLAVNHARAAMDLPPDTSKRLFPDRVNKDDEDRIAAMTGIGGDYPEHWVARRRLAPLGLPDRIADRFIYAGVVNLEQFRWIAQKGRGEIHGVGKKGWRQVEEALRRLDGVGEG